MNWNSFFFRKRKFSDVFFKILFWIVFLIAAFMACIVFSRGNLPLLFLGLLPFGYLSAILFIKVYLPGIADKFAYGFLFPRTYLDKAPPVLSPYQAMLSAGRYAEAFEALTPLAEQHPDDADVIFLYASAGMNLEGRGDLVFQKMTRFFGESVRNGQADNARLLFFFADQAVKTGRTEQLNDILRREMKRSCYTDAEKRSIGIRLRALERSVENADR